ncbi:MAG: formimidoylglutamate deiminase [Pyrinomonadaceae bacterium]
MSNIPEQAWLPDLVWFQQRFQRDLTVITNGRGRISRIASATEIQNPIRLRGRALLPGMINAHSHAFQRVIRGRTEYRTQATTDSFWTWRDLMYKAANQLAPEEIYVASSMAFLEMALSGITTVGEFHYIHNAPDGKAYEDPNMIAKEVIRAATNVGIRIALLRVAYSRTGFGRPLDPRQARFIENSPDTFLKNSAALEQCIRGYDDSALLGVAPHSVRAVPVEWLQAIAEFAAKKICPVHMHVAEQPAEVSACIEEYGMSPIHLLAHHGILSDRFTAVHAIHIAPDSADVLALNGARVCACPTTERNLGDGIVPVNDYFRAGVSVSLGTDSQTIIDLLEDARELEYHLRLKSMQRNILASEQGQQASTLASQLFDCATRNGARSLGCDGGEIKVGNFADFYTVDLNDLTLAGSDDTSLLANIVFSSSRAAVRDVIVGGKYVISDSQHIDQERIVNAFKKLQQRLWQ